MNALRENLLIQFAAISVIVMVIFALGISGVLTQRLNRHIGLIAEHSEAASAGTVIETSAPYSIENLTSDISTLRDNTLIAVGFGFLFLYVGLVTIVWRGWSTIGAQREQLENVNAELEKKVADRVGDLELANQRLGSEIGERANAEKKLRETLNELQQTQQQVVQHERMRALGQMASGIAHDFNNALSPIVSFSGMLLDSPESLDDKEQVREDLTIISTAAQDAAKVVKRLRDFYREPDLNEIVADVALNDIIKESVSLTQPRWRDQAQSEGLTIAVETELGEIPSVPGNPAELREALTNLLINASDAFKEDGTIKLTTRPEGAFVAIEISDSGVGMPPEVVERCMDPFYSTKGEKGTGMGLAMVYGIVQRHKGTIDVKSKLGEGTTFTMLVPLHRDTVAITITPQMTQGLSKALHVLVVDDDPLGRAVLGRLLEGDGHTFELAENGQEGLDKFQAGEYDLVITDRAMPGMNGDQLAEAVKQHAPATPIVMVTGFGDIMAGSAEKPEHIDVVVPKPIERDDLRRAMVDVSPA